MEEVKLNWKELENSNGRLLSFSEKNFENEISNNSGFCIFTKKEIFEKERPVVIFINYGNIRNIFKNSKKEFKDGYFCFSEYKNSDFKQVLNQLEFDILPLRRNSFSKNSGINVNKPNHNNFFSNVKETVFHLNKNEIEKETLEKIAKIDNVRIKYISEKRGPNFLKVSFLNWEMEICDKVKDKILSQKNIGNIDFRSRSYPKEIFLDYDVDTLTNCDLSIYV